MGFDFVDVTKKFRMGMPADFGAQLDFKIKGKFLNQFSIVNGEGPFRSGTSAGKFLFSNNIQYNPIEPVLKLYVDYAPNPDTVTKLTNKYVVSGFADL
ncbi:MAG: hypothetical protein R2764_24090 [Bacteroidales bacterium]